MRLVGTLPEVAPDPRIELAQKLKLMPIPVLGLVAQATLGDTNSLSLSYSMDDREYGFMTVGISYTLWRNPADHSDPVNLADLDEQTRRALEEVPPWRRPAWLVEGVERMRYPQLWEAVRTTWHRDASGHSSVSSALVEHVNHILMNQFRQELGYADIPLEPPAPVVTERNVDSRVSVVVDGVEGPAAEINTAPFVYGIGASLPGDGVVTAVIPRKELEHVRVEFATRR